MLSVKSAAVWLGGHLGTQLPVTKASLKDALIPHFRVISPRVHWAAECLSELEQVLIVKVTF